MSLFKRSVSALRKKLWRDMSGCTCQKVIEVNGRSVTLKSSEMCTSNAVRCNGRMDRIISDYEANGLKLGPEESADER